jgi:rhomboid protease GluP
MDPTGSNGRAPFRSTEIEPEILPPLDRGGEDLPPHATGPMPQSRPRPRWSYAPATYALVAINCAVFLPMLASPTANEFVLTQGSNWGARELINGEWWRLLTAIFVHNGFIHIAGNMWCLWNLGLLGEPLLGSGGMLAAYLLTGVAGNLLSTGTHPNAPGVGASGAVFGLAGVLIMLLKSPLLPVPREELNRLRRSVIWFAVLNFIIGGGVWLAHTALQIDNMAHLGGFLCGLALGVPLVPKIGARPAQFVRRQWIAFGGAAFALLLIAFYLFNIYRAPA